jgi:sialate O-acetylesterase
VHGGNPANPRTKVLRGSGPGLPFGVEMYKATGVPQGLIACAHGGTSMSQWDPALKKLGGHSLYGALYERLKMLGGRVAGLLWYQGCNETGGEATVASYEKNMKKLFKAFRRDCKNPDLPIVFAQLASYITQSGENTPQVNWFKIRDTQYKLGRTVANTVCVPAIDLEMDYMIHISNRAVVTLGKRFADAMLGLRGDRENIPQIGFKSAKCVSDKVMNYAWVIVECKNVQGKLTADGLPKGFAVVDKEGKVVAEAVSVRLEGNRAIIRTRMPYPQFDKYYRIAYGAALQPYANITDMAGRSLPCTVMDVSADHRPLSEFLQHALVSEAVYCDDSFQNFKLPENWEELNYQPAKFNTFYLPCPREEGMKDKAHKVYCYKFRVNAPEDMDVDLLFGADSSFILYKDGKEIKKQCTNNPVIMDQFVMPMFLSKGEHDFCCVFSSSSGCGWGICCRFRRKKDQVMPEFVKFF